eukprot:g2139.t1
MSLQSRQMVAVRTMINLNADSALPAARGLAGSSGGRSGVDGSATWSDKWKVLIYDAPCRSVISPLLSVKDLRQLGVTVYMLASSKREPIPDVPAVYFLEPTPENIDIIVRDVNAGLYETAYVNFSSTLPRALLEKLAEGTAPAGGAGAIRIAKLMDQYLNFVTLEPCLFSLDMPLSYYAYSRPNADGPSIQKTVNAVVDGLFSVIVTSGIVPVLRAAPGGPAEMVATKLDEKLRKAMRNQKTQHLFQRNGAGLGLEAGASGAGRGASMRGGAAAAVAAGGAAAAGILRERPVLVILDRDVDLAQVMHHTSLYQPLVHDLLDFRLNRVTFETSDSSGQGSAAAKPQKKSFTLDPKSDHFWSEFAGKLFPDAVEGNVSERERLQKAEQAISGAGQTGSMQGISAAVQALEKHTEDKKRMTEHLNLLEATMMTIVQRSLPEFYECEEAMMNASGGGRGNVTASEMERCFQLLGDSSKGTYLDKLRLVLVWILQCDVPAAVRTQLDEVLKECAAQEGKQEIHSSILRHIDEKKKIASVAALGGLREVTGSGAMSGNAGSASGLAGVGGAGFNSMFKSVTGAVGGLVGQVKAWMPKAAADTKITKLVAAVAKGQDNTRVSLYFDPKIGSRPGSLPTASRRNGGFGTAIVFVVGGATYTEYHNMRDYAARQKPPMTVLFGATEMLNAENFIDQIARFDPAYTAQSTGGSPAGAVD